MTDTYSRMIYMYCIYNTNKQIQFITGAICYGHIHPMFSAAGGDADVSAGGGVVLERICIQHLRLLCARSRAIHAAGVHYSNKQTESY